jgi:5'-nucleotidase
MRILLSNDDGFRAPGIAILAEYLSAIGDVVVVAPDRNRSGASNSLTLDRPLRMGRGENGFYWVDGTPTDCVHIAITELFEAKPDLVVAGINAGENLGDDVLYSGTVAAAMEGSFMGCPALAVSLTGTALQHYAAAAEVTCNLIGDIMRHGRGKNWLMNVNVPDRPLRGILGVRITRLGQRHKEASVLRQDDPRGRPIYWIGPPGAPRADTAGDTDFEATAQGFVSVTPLHTDLTAHGALVDLATWIGQ